MEVTIGGDRLGSGNKQKEYLDNYHRSTHDLGQKFASSMGAGILYPFLCLPATRGDHFSIDLNAAARTIPTQGPLFGSFKMQLDVFQCPVRLYQAFLHNNPLAIGLNANQIKLPKLVVRGRPNKGYNLEYSKSSLLKYLGMSGNGRYADSLTTGIRKINAVPALAYYDIFKTYYANKQEEKAYALGTDKKTKQYGIECVNVYDVNDEILWQGNVEEPETLKGYKVVYQPADSNENLYHLSINFNTFGEELSLDELEAIMQKWLEENTMLATAIGVGDSTHFIYHPYDIYSNLDEIAILITPADNAIDITITALNRPTAFLWKNIEGKQEEEIALIPFDLKNIDDMRMQILSYHTLGSSFEVNYVAQPGIPYTPMLPYDLLVNVSEDGFSKNCQKLNGLVVKTYQSDIFNSWINTDWIDGENGINEITKVAVTDGAMYIDSLILARKLYDMLNRVALSGGTYDDWQDVVWTESPTRHIESPLYIGGMSDEVVFEEIVQTSPSVIDGEKQTLGTLGGRGTLLKKKGGQIDVKCDEACFIIGIVSLTPRIFYTQGNEFYMTELDSIDDFHKPALDGIGFQDLIGERMAYFDTKLNTNGTIISRSRIGKVPAWQEYMTAVDKAYGDFAEIEGDGFMVLNRNYEQAISGGIKDATTYIDPQKYNYAFAYTKLDSQNFWVEVDAKVTSRRLISAKQIPNL